MDEKGSLCGASFHIDGEETGLVHSTAFGRQKKATKRYTGEKLIVDYFGMTFRWTSRKEAVQFALLLNCAPLGILPRVESHASQRANFPFNESSLRSKLQTSCDSAACCPLASLAVAERQQACCLPYHSRRRDQNTFRPK